MIEITKRRDGTLTEVTAICPGHDVAQKAASAFAHHGRIVKRDGLVLRTTCKRSSADALVEALERLSFRTAPTNQKPVSRPAGRDETGARRRLIVASEGSEHAARALPGFAGFGEEFIAGEKHGDLEGDRVRYAYYS